MVHVLEHAFLDTLTVLPFLIIIYVLIELIEHKTEIAGRSNRFNGKLGPLIGSATGLIPQCGFSVMAAKLYESGFLKLGTILAIFIATSDEAFIILISKGDALNIMYIIIVKIIVAVSVGYLVNAFCKNESVQISTVKDYKSRVYEKKFEYTSCCSDHDEEKPVKTYIVSPLLHSLKITLYILIVNVIFGALVHYLGEDKISEFLQGSIWLQPFITALVGLIPNCASSVVITETFIIGGITFGSCIAGLCTNAGLGLVVLFKNTKEWKRNLLITLILYSVGVITGSILNAVALIL